MFEHVNDCICQSCHDTRDGLWSVVIPAATPLVLRSTPDLP